MTIYADLNRTLLLFPSYCVVFLMQDVTEEAAHDSLVEQETATGVLQV